jgi:1-deoxy-D-xylulose-5-phosphate reductoisomerase
LPYLQIPAVVEKVLNTIPTSSANSLELILSVDASARDAAQAVVKEILCRH